MSLGSGNSHDVRAETSDERRPPSVCSGIVEVERLAGSALRESRRRDEVDRHLCPECGELVEQLCAHCGCCSFCCDCGDEDDFDSDELGDDPEDD